MTRVVAVANTKGGVGKSTLAVNLSIEAVLAGHCTLLVDADPQGSSIQFLSVRDDDRPAVQGVQMVQPCLHKQIPHFSELLDFVFIDVGGRDSKIFRSALVASNTILVPMVPSAFDAWASEDVFGVVEELLVADNTRQAVVVLNQVTRTIIAHEALRELREDFGEHGVQLLDTQIFSRTAWPRSTGEGLGVREWEPRGLAASELGLLTVELGIRK